MRVRFFLPENTGSKVSRGGKMAAGTSEGRDADVVRFRSMRNALAAPRAAWQGLALVHLSAQPEPF
jgi:hypothetical protein